MTESFSDAVVIVEGCLPRKKCYDAECIFGTPYWHNLPIFRRGLSIDPEDVKPKHRTDALESRL